MLANSRTPAGDLVFGFAIRTDLFESDWSTCDRIANYAATLVSHRRVDPLRYSNLLSSALNEVLETAFRRHGPNGEIGFAVYRGAPADSIVLTLPSDAATRDFYAAAVEQARRDDVHDRFIGALLHDGPVDPGIGLLELAADYKASLALETGGDALTLTVELVLDEATH